MIMKSRLPRKRKKIVKAIVSRNSARKVVMSSVVTVQSVVQIARIQAMPLNSFDPGRSVAVLGLVTDTAQAIQKIMSAPPNHWREFIE